MHLLRPFAFLAATPSLIGVFILLGDDFNVGMLWLLGPALVAGLVLSPRFYPLELVGKKATDRMNAAWKRTFKDLGWLSLGYLVVLFVWAIVVQFVDTDASAFGLAPLLALFAGGAALLGTLVGMLVVLPIITLVQQTRIALGPNAADRAAIAGAVLLLSVVVFVGTLVGATSIEDGHSSRGRAWAAIFVLLTGVQTEDARVTSEPLAWIARVSLVILIASGFALYRISRGRRKPKVEA